MAAALTLPGMEIILGCVMVFGAGRISGLFFAKDGERTMMGNAKTKHTVQVAQMSRSMTLKFAMSAEALFGVAVRAIGIWNIAYGLWWIPGTCILLYELTQIYPTPCFKKPCGANWEAVPFASPWAWLCSSTPIALSVGPMSQPQGNHPGRPTSGVARHAAISLHRPT